METLRAIQEVEGETEISSGSWTALAEVWKVQPEACGAVAAGRGETQFHRPWLTELTLSALAANAPTSRFLPFGQVWR